MSKRKISSRDLELLSAYLDGQLSSKDTAHLETRLWEDEALRNALDELDRTRTMLRSLPRKRAPRNFTLSAEYVQQRSSSRLYPIFGFASALAAVLLLAVLLGDLFGLVFPTAEVAQPVTTQATIVILSPEMTASEDSVAKIPTAALEAVVSTETTVSDSEPSPTLTEVTPSVSPTNTQTKIPTLIKSATPTPTPSPTTSEREDVMIHNSTDTPESTVTPSKTTSPTTTCTDTHTPEPTSSPTSTSTPVTPTATRTDFPEIVMQDEPTQQFPTLTTSRVPAPDTSSQVSPQGKIGDQPVWLVMEIGLVITVFITVIATIWNYRRRLY